MVYVYFIVLGYLLGSIPFGKIIAHSRGVDIQQRGSGNIGFANVRRVLGWRAALLTLAGDILKGLLPTLLALLAGDATLAFWVGVAAVTGHLVPLWLKFRGGKGVATGFGVILALQPAAALLGGLVYLVSCALKQKSSLGSLLGTVTVAAIGVCLHPSAWWQYALLTLIICWKLRHNFRGTVPNYE